MEGGPTISKLASRSWLDRIDRTYKIIEDIQTSMLDDAFSHGSFRPA
jgi:hypothetical protein